MEGAGRPGSCPGRSSGPAPACCEARAARREGGTGEHSCTPHTAMRAAPAPSPAGAAPPPGPECPPSNVAAAGGGAGAWSANHRRRGQGRRLRAASRAGEDAGDGGSGAAGPRTGPRTRLARAPGAGPVRMGQVLGCWRICSRKCERNSLPWREAKWTGASGRERSQLVK